MTEKHPTSEPGACTVRQFVSYEGNDAAGDRVGVAIVCFDFVADHLVLCVVRNLRTREVTTRQAWSLTEAVEIMETWLGGPVPL